MERPAQQKAGMGERDKRKKRRRKKKKKTTSSEALTENITVWLKESDNSDECRDEDTVLVVINHTAPTLETQIHNQAAALSE